MMNTTERRALEFVRSVKGGPTPAEFDAMHVPLGPILAPKLVNLGLIRISDGRLRLTKEGISALANATPDLS